jgi:hypothetical protein
VRPRVLVSSAALLVAALLGGACGGGTNAEAEATSAKDIEQLPEDLLPSEILGLQVQREDMAGTLQGAQRSYVQSVGLYSLRKDDLLQATIQVSEFNNNARVDDSDFRRSLLAQVGGSVPKQVVLGGESIWLTTGTKQTLAVFFRQRLMFVVAVRDDYGQPRTLVREALDLEVTV